MTKTDKMRKEDSIDLKTIFHLFLRRKWWFIVPFLVVLVLGMMYMLSRPIFYEVKYKFSFEDEFLPDDHLKYSGIEELYKDRSVFIEAEEVSLIFETDLIFRSLADIDEIGDNYSDYIDSSLQDLDLDNDTSIFTLEVKNTDKQLADDIARNLIESLGTQVMNNDLEILGNTLSMLEEDIKTLEESNVGYGEKIAVVDEEIEDMYKVLAGENKDPSSNRYYYDIIEKKGEKLIYKGKIVDNEHEIKRLDKLYQEFTEEKDKVHNRVQILTEDPSLNVENNRLINSIIVILLSFLTGIVVVLIVNYIYKLRRE